MTVVLDYGPELQGGAVCVDLDRLIASRMLVQANSGGGKSRALRHLLEQTHGRVQQIVLDPEGEFGTLRERFEYVLAGKEADVPATPKTARLLCRRLVELGTSAVIDLYDLSLPDRREFVKIFLVELMALPRALWRPILVVIDEAHVFAPQTGEAQSTDAVIALCTQGRKRGFCAVLATQRISKLHKDAAAELLNKLIGRTGLDVDQKRAGDELGLDKEGRAALSRLEPGAFYVYGPAISNEIRIVRTGKVQTSHPEAGRLAAAPPPPTPKVRALLQKELADLPKEAEAETNRIEDLERHLAEARKQVRRLESNGRIVEKPVIDQAAITAAVEREAGRAAAELREIQRRIGLAAGAFGEAAERLTGGLEVLMSVTTDLSRVPVEPRYRAWMQKSPIEKKGAGSQAPPPRVQGDGTSSIPFQRERAVAPSNGVKVSRPQQGMLNAVASLDVLGITPAPRTTVAALTGQSPRSPGWEKNMSTLRSAGLIHYPDADSLTLTDAGVQIAQAGVSITSLADLHAAWREMLSGPQWRICEALIGVYPDAMDRAALAAETGQAFRSPGWDKNLSTLRSLGLIAYPTADEAVATSLLMPEALRT